MQLNPDFRAFIEYLNANGVRYLLVGGYAVAHHGHPRYTKDLDIWLEVTQDNSERVIRTLSDFGLSQLGLEPTHFLEPNAVIQLGYPPRRIDLLTSLDGVAFEDCYAKRLEVDWDGLKIALIDLDNLIRNKRASGRHQDLADVENLERPNA